MDNIKKVDVPKIDPKTEIKWLTRDIKARETTIEKCNSIITELRYQNRALTDVIADLVNEKRDKEEHLESAHIACINSREIIDRILTVCRLRLDEYERGDSKNRKLYEFADEIIDICKG